MSQSRTNSPEMALAAEVMRYEHDPLGFARAAYPWGEGELEGEPGLRAWQVAVLDDIGTKLRAGVAHGAALAPILKAIGSGHGIGKSAMLAIIVGWALSTCPHCKVVLTANTEQQLRTKTWPEITKWMRLMACASWFKVQGTSIVSTFPGAEKTWRCDAVTWSENNTQAFAGLHNKGRRLVMLFDEASGVADPVWDVASGALTDEDTEIVWIACGQLAEPQGRFFEAFNVSRARWSPVSIDSREVEGTNKTLLAAWVAEYGEDHDFVRVRVRGLPPRAGTMQFIGPDLIADAIGRPMARLPSDRSDPLVFGVDVARFGDDQSVILMRRGRDAASLPVIKLRGADTMHLAARVAELVQVHRPDAVFVDGGGVGGGVVDRLKMLGVKVHEVQFGGRADRVSVGPENHGFANKRAEMWGNMKEWLKGGSLPPDPDLRADLSGPNYSFVVREGRDVIILERKQDMKARGMASPDVGDALALTFAYPVIADDLRRARRDRPQSQHYGWD